MEKMRLYLKPGRFDLKNGRMKGFRTGLITFGPTFSGGVVEKPGGIVYQALVSQTFYPGRKFPRTGNGRSHTGKPGKAKGFIPKTETIARFGRFGSVKDGFVTAGRRPCESVVGITVVPVKNGGKPVRTVQKADEGYSQGKQGVTVAQIGADQGGSGSPHHRIKEFPGKLLPGGQFYIGLVG